MSRETRVLLAAFAMIALGVLASTARDLETPGLYYDEVIQATPASEFLREGGRRLEIPGASSKRLFGGWFPVMTVPYMGALKSQLLIPAFALFGSSPATLRLTTLVWGLAGLLLCMLWVRSVWGLPAALLTGWLLACDPSFVFVTRHDWGSVSLALLLRGGGYWLLWTGWQRRSGARVAAGGLALGLGVFNKIDCLAALGGAGLGLVLCAPRPVWRAVRSRPAFAAVGIGALVLGAAPMLRTLVQLVASVGRVLDSSGARSAALDEKLALWSAFFDGSYFHRMIVVGGKFENLARADVSGGWFGWVFGVALLGLAGAWLWELRERRADAREGFAVLACSVTLALLFAMPLAARVHHAMNAMPLPQLVVALAALRLWRMRHLAARGVAALALGAAVVGSLGVDARVWQTLRETGGRARWSDALLALARGLPADARVVSLDWGFHLPLVFLRPELALEEPIWGLPRVGSNRALVLRGGPAHRYLVQEPDFSIFGTGDALLHAVGELPMRDARVVVHTDRAGAPAFREIRFARSHELVYRDGVFDVRLR